MAQPREPSTALPCFPSRQCSALLGCVVRAAAGENTEQQQPWDLNHFCFGHFGLRGSIWASPAQRAASLFALFGSGRSPCVCVVLLLCLEGCGDTAASRFQQQPLFVEAIKEAPFEISCLHSFDVVHFSSHLEHTLCCVLRKA